MFLDFTIKVFEENKDKEAVVWKDKVYNYQWLLDRFYYWQDKIRIEKIKAGTVIILEADFSPNSVAFLLAFIEKGCILVPLTSSVEAKKPEFINIAQGEICFSINEKDEVEIKKLPNIANRELYNKLKQLKHPGLVLFSSGSTGKSKAAVHDFLGILEKFKEPRRSLRTITFLPYDHIGGLNTMFYILSNAGCIITVKDRGPDEVLAVVEKYKVELLPTSPTFINLVLLSEAYKRHNINSLKIVTYGTEPMPKTTLTHFHNLFPNIQLQQTYGLSEVGILRSKSKSSNSLWVKVGGEDFQTRVVDGILQIKAKSAMLGYLNAPSPFTADGWFNTDDLVDVDGEYVKFLGRNSEIINVGGEKVYPAEVEDVIQGMDSVSEVIVYGEPNPIVGNIVCAKVSLLNHEEHKQFARRLKQYCLAKMQSYKVPVKIQVTDKKQHSDRFKKERLV